MTITKRILLVLICLFTGTIICAQQKITITGQVTNAQKEPLPFSDVLLTVKGKSNSMLTFSVANKEGAYKIQWTPDTTALQVEVSMMGYNKGVKPVNIQPGKSKYTLNFMLEERTEEIDEVSVIAAPIVQVREDTTIFNLARIRDSSEVVVEDLIKKLPGMTIEGNGQIKFKGKDVKKVLLDGDDLFENNYTLGTKNINADHIEGISAVENYTHNPLLRGVEITDDVAINLKFKPGLSLSHNLKAGYGADDRYSITHKGIVVTKKVKAFTLLNHNTLGQNSSDGFFDAGSYIRNMAATKDTEAPTFLGLSMSPTQGQRNEAYFGSINIMPKLTETFTARLNMNYFSDKAESESYYKQIITSDPDNPIVIEQSNQQTDLPRFFNGKLYMEKYLSKTDRIDNTTVFSRKRNSSDNSGLNNGVAQELDKSAKDHYFNNQLNYTKRLKGSKSLFFGCNISSDESTEELFLLPGLDVESGTVQDDQVTTQDVRSKKQRIDLNTTFMVALFKKHKINVNLSSSYYKTSLGTLLSGVGQENQFSNDIDYKVFIPNVDFSYQYKYRKLEILPSMSFKLYNYDYYNGVSQAEEKQSDLLLNASLGIKYKLMPRHLLSLNLRNTEKAPEDKRIYDNYILTSNRMLQNNEIDFGAQKSQSANITYSYQSLLSDLSYSIGANYNKNNHQYQSDYIINQDLSLQTSYLSDNGSEGYGINAQMRVKLGKILDHIGLSYNYNNNEYSNSVNSDVLRKNKNEQNTYNFNFQTKLFWNMFFSNKSTLSQSDYYTEGVKTSRTERLNNNLSLYMNLFKRLSLKAAHSYMVPSTDNFDNAYQSLNASLRFTNKKKTIIYTLDGQNLIDENSSRNVSNNEYSQTISSNNLQRRYFLFSMEVRF
ncbi:carboxypeptidase-like regulatory domain-containing protein [Marinifilum sp.]|uniref:carboxypeptidase-like regulatory domain-containing protein n=1 Tax=Marinifilum sp. TaxID=2033137 RepID=UPI003BAC588D